MNAQTFINLPVRDLERSKLFFSNLGFKFNPQFTDENAACMIINENTLAMLLVEKFFETFIPGKTLATNSQKEVLVALSVQSREDVDTLVENAIKAGGSEYRKKTDFGWMYGRAFLDIDGHIWEVLHMDESKIPEEVGK